jgi:DNA polymerase I-like protein with 3'-5' exonuclease and polymerase domains
MGGVARTLPIASLDTETTGANFRRGDRPYSVAIAYPGHLKDIDKWPTEYFCWPVNPITREVKPVKSDLKRIQKIINTHRMVFHNAKFDLRALESVGIGITKVWAHFEDTLPASHVCNTGESHNLKDLALKYLSISDEDEEYLRQLVVSLRREAKKLGWNTSNTVACDYWLPAEMIRRGLTNSLSNDDLEACERYNTLDAKRTLALWMMYYGVLNREGLFDQYTRERRLLRVVYNIETRGVTLKKKTLGDEIRRYGDTAEKHREQCERVVNRFDVKDFNVDSTQQVGNFLFQRMKFEPTALTKTEQPSTAAAPLRRLYTNICDLKTPRAKTGEEFLRNYLEYKLNNSARTTCEGYLEKAIKCNSDIRIYHTLNQNGARTTRFTHQDPNTANVGKGKELEDVMPWLDFDDEDEEVNRVDFTLRKVFGPGVGRVWFPIDYDQLQLRIFAAAAGETKLIEGFRRGLDAHTMVACELYGVTPEEFAAIPKEERTLKRRNAKTINFGFLFGMQPETLEWRTGIKGLAKQLNDIFPHLEEFQAKTDEQAFSKGYVTTLGGYRIPVRFKTKYRNGRRVKTHTGVCDIIQGTEGEIVKNAMIAVDDLLNNLTSGHAYITLQVHDELVLDFPKNDHDSKDYELSDRKKILREVMTEMMRAGANVGVETPVSVEKVLTNWAEGFKINDRILAKDRGQMEDHVLVVRPYAKSGVYAGGNVTQAAHNRQYERTGRKYIKSRPSRNKKLKLRCPTCEHRCHGERHRNPRTGKPCPRFWAKNKWCGGPLKADTRRKRSRSVKAAWAKRKQSKGNL